MLFSKLMATVLAYTISE